MNPSTLIGILVSTAFLAVVLLFAVDDPMLFVDVPGLAIVLGGTLAATFLSYPLREVLRIVHLVGTVFRHDRLNTSKDIDELVRMSRLWIQGDLRAVEQALAQVTNPFLRTGVQLIIDRTPEADILDLLQWRIPRLQVKKWPWT